MLIENLIGSNFADILRGDAGANTIRGGLAHDLFYGRNGDDVLIGGLGNDILSGGAHADVFVFDVELQGANADRITDFSAADDTIHLDDAVFAGLSLGTLSAAAFRANISGLADAATDRIIYDVEDGFLSFDRDGSGPTYAPVWFATLTTRPTISAADFVVI